MWSCASTPGHHIGFLGNSDVLMQKPATLPHTHTTGLLLIHPHVKKVSDLLKLSGSRSQENCLSHNFPAPDMSAFKRSWQDPACACCFPLSPPPSQQQCRVQHRDAEAKGPFPLEPVPCHCRGWAGKALSDIYTDRVHTSQIKSELWIQTHHILDWTFLYNVCSLQRPQSAGTGSTAGTGSPPHLPTVSSLPTPTTHTEKAWHKNRVLNPEQVYHHKACHWFTGHSDGPVMLSVW